MNSSNQPPQSGSAPEPQPQSEDAAESLAALEPTFAEVHRVKRETNFNFGSTVAQRLKVVFERCDELLKTMNSLSPEVLEVRRGEIGAAFKETVLTLYPFEEHCLAGFEGKFERIRNANDCLQKLSDAGIEYESIGPRALFHLKKAVPEAPKAPLR